MKLWSVVKISSLAVLGIAISIALSLFVVNTIAEKDIMSSASPDAGFDLSVDGQKAKKIMKSYATNENPIVATVDKNGNVKIQSGPKPVAPPKNYDPRPQGVERWDD